MDDALLDVPLPDEHPASTIPSNAAVASIALAFRLTMTFRRLPGTTATNKRIEHIRLRFTVARIGYQISG
jgi:hypothetical protein